MNKNIKLIKPHDYLLELDIKNALYLSEFFDESDFGKKNENVYDEPAGITFIDDEPDDDENWISVASSEKSESSENSESLDFAAMNDDELIAYYNYHNPEVVKLNCYAPYYLDNYIFDYYTKDSLLVVYGKLFYRLSPYDDSINVTMKDLIIDFELRFDTTNAKLGQIDMLSSIIKANVNNRISCNQPLSSIVNDVVLIPFNFEKILPKNVKLLRSTKEDAFNFNNLQYLDYEWKPKSDFNW